MYTHICTMHTHTLTYDIHHVPAHLVVHAHAHAHARKQKQTQTETHMHTLVNTHMQNAQCTRTHTYDFHSVPPHLVVRHTHTNRHKHKHTHAHACKHTHMTLVVCMLTSSYEPSTILEATDRGLEPSKGGRSIIMWYTTHPNDHTSAFSV